MTIKVFAKLCDCNPQTLRYYDSVGLLKPAEVDSWTGYRYYNEEQAVTFVKIRNLQKAGFAIEEIKELLLKDDLAIAKAFDAKIAEAEAHLREIKAIRASYLTEMSTIKEKINETRERIITDIKNYNPEEEFGMPRSDYEAMLASIEQCFREAAESTEKLPDFGEMLAGAMAGASQAAPEARDFRTDPAFSVIYEKHGFRNVKDFFPEFASQESGEYGLDFHVTDDKYEHAIAFSNTILSMLLSANEEKNRTFHCNIALSADGRNHFRLLKKAF